MSAIRAVVLLAAAALLPPARAQTPRLADDYVVLHTVAGDIVLGLYPDVAPRHVEQFLKLVRLGVYDTADFFSVVPGFYAEVAVQGERTAELSPLQEAAIHPLKAEFSKLQHTAGTLSMARDERDPNSAETAFSIILTDWPEGDGRYTIFGRVASGMAVVDELVKVPRGDDGRPVVRLSILKAEAVKRAALPGMRLAPAQPVPIPTELAEAKGEGASKLHVLAGGIALMIFIGIATFAAGWRYPKAQPSLVLINVLIGFFLLLTIVTPTAHLHPTMATGLFLGLLGTLKLMSQFETPS